MKLRLTDYEGGILKYWSLVDSRSACVQDTEDEFPKLATIYASRNPPHFTRSDLEGIIKWKHNMDARRRTTALQGLAEFPDDRIIGLTSAIGDNIDGSLRPFFCKSRYAGEISNVGIATASAILTAARPDLFAVIDTYALAAIYHHYDFPWLYKIGRDENGKLVADWNCYPQYVAFCRAEAAKLTLMHNADWTPRKIEMALWGIGKELEEKGLL
jgi:hypothetical protein